LTRDLFEASQIKNPSKTTIPMPTHLTTSIFIPSKKSVKTNYDLHLTLLIATPLNGWYQQ